MTAPNPIDADLFAKNLKYDAHTGEFFWRVPGHGRQMDKPTGSVCGVKNRPYVRIYLMGATYSASRVAYALMNGRDVPEGMVMDHINGDTLDNRWANLRCVSHRANATNRKTTSSTGIKGVYATRSGKFRVVTCVGGKSVHHGTFKTVEKAQAKYREVAADLGLVCEQVA